MDHRASEPASAPIGHPAAGNAAAGVDVVDLQKFCGNSGNALRSWTMKPFRIGAHVYATDGIILVRVDNGCPDFEELPETLRHREKIISRIEGYFKRERIYLYVPYRVHLPPPARPVECFDCDGRGTLHECPECKCTCGGCNGEGINDPERHTTVDFAGGILTLKFVRLMLSLPAIEIASGSSSAELSRPLIFRFANGAGALMPCSKRGQNHVNIEPSNDTPIT